MHYKRVPKSICFYCYTLYLALHLRLSSFVDSSGNKLKSLCWLLLEMFWNSSTLRFSLLWSTVFQYFNNAAGIISGPHALLVSSESKPTLISFGVTSISFIVSLNVMVLAI